MRAARDQRSVNMSMEGCQQVSRGGGGGGGERREEKKRRRKVKEK